MHIAGARLLTGLALFVHCVQWQLQARWNMESGACVTSGKGLVSLSSK